MKLYFKQRFFSWFDSYDIFDENGNTVYTVKGVLSWGHCLKIYDIHGNHVGTVKEEVLTFLPRFSIYIQDRYVGSIKKEFTFFKPRFYLEHNEWKVEGDWFEWDYQVYDANGTEIMQAQKQLFRLTDTYELDIYKEEDVLCCLMIVLAIDAAKCSAS